MCPHPGRWSAGVLGLAGWVLLGAGCGVRGTKRLEARVALQVEPQPPRVGTSSVTVRITGTDDRPLAGLDVRLEGNMSHPGMVPVFAAARETGPGVYQAPLKLTMGGDWFLIVTAVAADGRRLEQQIPLPGVQSR